MKKLSIWKKLLMLCAFTALVAGCSSSGGAGGGGSSTGGAISGTAGSAASGSSTAQGSPIAIGVIGVYSGQDVQSSLDGKYVMQAWAQYVNAHGGVAGHPVKLYIQDTQGNAANGLTEMKQLVEQDNIVAVVGPADANITWATYLDGKGIPVVGGGQLALQYMTDPNFFSIGGNLLSVFDGITRLAVKAGPMTAILYCAEVPGCKAAGDLEGTLGKPHDLSVVVSQGVAASSTDFTAVCEAIKNSGAQSWNISVSSALLPRIVAQCQTLGYRGSLVEPGTPTGTQEEGDPALNGLQVADGWIGWPTDSTPATEEFHNAIKQYEPVVGTSQVPLNSIGMASWISGKLFQAAVSAAGVTASTEVTSAVVKKGLYALDGQTLGGMTPPLTYKPGQPNVFNCYFTYSIANAKFVAPDATPTCAGQATNTLIASIIKSFSK